MENRSTIAQQSADIKYLIHHIFLPPKLPGGDDSFPDHEKVLVQTILDALQEYGNSVAVDQVNIVRAVARTISSLKTVLDAEGHVDECSFSAELRALPEKGANSAQLPCQVHS
jgi:hypothetical protein